MKGRNVVFTLLLILLLLVLAVVRRWQEPKEKEAFDRQATVAYTAFSLCQMQCKAVRKKDVMQVMQKGIIIFNRSNRRRWPCPSFAVQARLPNGRNLRIIFEQCENKTTVLACDDLAQTANCSCAEEP